MAALIDREQRVRRLIEGFGLNQREAAFAVAPADGETAGCIRAIAFPFPEVEARQQATILIEQLGFTPDEADRDVAGDRTAIAALFARRRAAEQGDLANIDSPEGAPALSVG